MEEARELLLKHLYLQGGDGLGISDGRVYNACLDAIMEALTIPVVSVNEERVSVCGWCRGQGWIDYDMTTEPCSACGGKQTER